MAFGRSNSLSLNTGATNSLLYQGSSLFGNNTQPAQPQQQTGLFGNSTQNAAAPVGGSLFGNTNNAQPSGGSLFGNSTAQQQQQPGTSLFGNTSTQQQPNTGLFGNTTAQQQPNTSLFGNTTTQQQPSTGLFGASTAQNNTTGASLFSNLNQQNQQQPTTSLFGNTNNNTSSLFGAKPTASQPTTNSLFSNSLTNTQNRPNGASVFGMQSQQQAGAVRVHLNDLRGTTRFTDCVDEVKNDFERVDKMIREQEEICRRIQAFMPKHGENVEAVPASVAVVREKAEGVEMMLAQDAVEVNSAKGLLGRDEKDFARCQRVAENLMLPVPGYQAPGVGSSSYLGSGMGRVGVAGQPGTGLGEDEYDTDLVNHYFLPLASDLEATFGKYTSNLAEIEGHMRVLEDAAVGRARSLAAKRAGLSGGQNGGGGEETVRELADTLRGFEQSILAVAGVVGECREGVNELVLGRLG
ncbi:hypothetical protein BAUCODRAFT_97744, partial [Baudoinia panamericana UAMH 10762]